MRNIYADFDVFDNAVVSHKIIDTYDVIIAFPRASCFYDSIKYAISKGKKFLFVGDMRDIISDELFSYLQSNELWFGIKPLRYFLRADGSSKSDSHMRWFTNMRHFRRDYIAEGAWLAGQTLRRIDNYSAIYVSSIWGIPALYMDEMAIPLSFIEYYNPEYFEIIGNSKQLAGVIEIDGRIRKEGFYLNHKRLPDCVVVKRKKIKINKD